MLFGRVVNFFYEDQTGISEWNIFKQQILTCTTEQVDKPKCTMQLDIFIGYPKCVWNLILENNIIDDAYIYM